MNVRPGFSAAWFAVAGTALAGTGAIGQTWEAVPLVTASQRSAGIRGGEGAQWPQAIAIAHDGQFLLFGTDVGGIYRSLNGGKNWEPCNVGFSPRGCCGFAIDPANPNRCLAVGSNSIVNDTHGLYLSTNRGASWKRVLDRADYSGQSDRRDQLAFDPNSVGNGRTQTAYWSCQSGGLYKTTNGSETWTKIQDGMGDSIVRVHARSHRLYIANKDGLATSDNGGQTFHSRLVGPVVGFDCTGDTVVAVTGDGLHISHNAGTTFAPLTASGLPAPKTLRELKISPADPRHIVLWADRGSYDWPRFASEDGGATWQLSRIDARNAFLPSNARQAMFAWHPTRPNEVWTFGGDSITHSRDGGKTYVWDANGYNGILVGGAFRFCTQNPNTLYVASQDYNGGVTFDGGKTWTYTNVSGNGWGGFTYGGYAASDRVLVAGDAAGWSEPRKLKVSRDGGKTWTGTGLVFQGPDVSGGDPGDPNVIFASNYRSGDGGQTWQAMTDTDAVWTSSDVVAAHYVLVGTKYHEADNTTHFVGSINHGLYWADMSASSLPGQVNDVAYNREARAFYVVSEDRLKQFDYRSGKWITLDTPADEFGARRVKTVALDPHNPQIIYVGSAKDIYDTSVSVLRSTDAGLTWTNLTLTTPIQPGQRDGGREAICIRVHPKTRYAWVATSCYGIWKIAPPPKK